MEWQQDGEKEWLKENAYILGNDYFKGRDLQNKILYDVFDKNGNVIGRLDRNYRVNGKVVPDHVHLKSDKDNVHHWFND